MSSLTPRRPTALRALLVVVLVLVALAGCAAPATGPVATPPTGPHGAAELTTADVDDWLDGMLPATLEREGLAGATVSVVADGRVLTARGYGAADVGAADRPAIPIDARRTLFRVGSISKVITATAVLQQVERGRLDLDTDVATYLDFPLRKRFDEPITLRHLLTHSAGYEDRYSGVVLAAGTPTPALRQVVSVDQPEQLYRPGTTPAYSNYSSALAGYIVERVSGTPFDDYVEQEIFAPARMTDATFRQPLPAGAADRVAQGYRTIDTPPVGFEVLGPAPAGSMSATATDMAQFMLAQLGSTPAGQPDLLSDATRELMATPALGPDQVGGLAGGDQLGLAWWRGEQNGRVVLGHGGDTQVFHSQLIILPTEGTGIFVSFKTSGASPDATSAARTALTEGFVDRYHPAGSTQPVPAVTTTSAEHAAAAAGTYTLSRRGDSTFMRAASVIGPKTVTDHRDGTISIPGLASTGGRSLRLQEVAATDRQWLWREVGGDRVVAMDVVDGEVRGIGMMPAHVLLPAPVEWSVATAVAVGAMVWSVLVLLAWPIGAVVRRRHRVSIADWSGGRKTLRLLTHLGLVVMWVALLGWQVVLSLFAIPLDPPAVALRLVWGATVLAAVATVPAVLQVVSTIRHRGGVMAVIANALTALALLGFGAAAWVMGLLSWDISF